MIYYVSTRAGVCGCHRRACSWEGGTFQLPISSPSSSPQPRSHCCPSSRPPRSARPRIHASCLCLYARETRESAATTFCFMSRPSPPLQPVGEHRPLASSSHYRPQPLNSSAIRHRHDGFGSSSRGNDDGTENGSPWRSVKARSKGTGNGKGKGKARGKEKAKGRASWGSEQEEWVKEGFRRFGEHCARNQVGVARRDCGCSRHRAQPL